MTQHVLASAIGDLPRPQEITNLFNAYSTVYTTETSLSLMSEWAERLAVTQRDIGLSHVNGGNVFRASPNACFFDSCDGFVPVRSSTQYFFDDGMSWEPNFDEKRRIGDPVWLSPNDLARHCSIVIDRLGWIGGDVENSVFVREARALTNIGGCQKIAQIPAPWELARRSWHPNFSRPAYKTREEYVEAILSLYSELIPALESVGIDVVQIDDSTTCYLQSNTLEKLLDTQKEIESALRATNEVAKLCKIAKSRAHIARSTVRFRSIPWSSSHVMPRFAASLKADEVSLSMAQGKEDTVALEGIEEDKTLVIGIISPWEPDLESPADLFTKMRAVKESIANHQLIVSPEASFLASGNAALPLTAVENKLRTLPILAETMNEHGLGEQAEKTYEKRIEALRIEQDSIAVLSGRQG